MATGMKVVCQQCGQVYAMQKEFNPWPPCPKCKGQLLIQVESDSLVVADSPAKAAPHQKQAAAPFDVFAQVGANPGGASDPFASAGVSKTLPPATPASSGVPLIAWLAIGGGVMLLGLVMLIVVGLFLFRSRPPIAKLPNTPPPGMSRLPNANPARPTPPSFNNGNQPTIPANPVTPSRDFAKEHEERVAKMKQDHEERVAKMKQDMEASRKKAGFGDSESASNSGPKSSGTLSASTDRPSGLGFGGSGEQSTFQPRTPWDVKLDPQPVIEYPVTEKLLEIDFKTRVDQLVFPDCPSPFFAAANDEFRKQDVRIFDLRTGRSIRKIPGELNNDKDLSTLNADGEHMATVIRGKEGTNIVVANTKSGKLVHSIAIDKDSTVKDLAFAGPGRLLAVVEGRGADREYRVGVWDLLEGKSITDFALQNPVKERFSSSYFYKEGSLAVSPGGKYFLCALSNVLDFYEVETGKLAGQLQIAEAQRELDNPSFAFSPDGKELTVMNGRRAEDAMLFRIDISNGEVIGSAKVNVAEFKETSSYHETLSKLQYIPALDCYLIDGTFVVERTTGEGLFRLDAFGGMACVIEGSRIVGVVKRDNAAGLAEFRLPKDEIEKLAAILKGGGKLLDGIWGEAKTSELSSAKKLQQPISATPWNLVLSPATERVSAKKTLTLPVPASPDRMNSWHVDPPLFSSLGGKIAWLPWSDRSHSRLNVIDVTSGAAEGNLDMLPGSRVLDLSPDGSLVLAALGKKSSYFSSDATFERLEVFSIPQKKHLLAWKLNLAVSTDQKGPSFRQEDPRLFRKAYFIEKTLVLTQMDGGRLILWKLPEAKPEWVLDGKTEIAGFTPDRLHVLLHSREMKKFSWLELRTGEWKGDLPGDDQTTTALAFSPDRTKIASLLSRNGYSQIVIRKVGTEEPTVFNVPGLGNSLEWLDDRYLIGLREGVIFDSENGVPLWRINFDGNVVRAPDSTCWHYGKTPGSLVLTKTIIPSDPLKAKIKAIKGIPLTPLVGPGSHLAIRSGFPTDADAMQKIQQEFQRRGWVLDPNAPFGINATVSQEAGKSVEYKSSLSRQTTSVNVPGATIITLSISANTGLELWKTEYRTGGGYAPSMVHLRQGEDLQSKVNSSSGSASNTPTLSSIPDIIFPKDAYLRLTTSRMNEKGEQF